MNYLDEDKDAQKNAQTKEKKKNSEEEHKESNEQEQPMEGGKIPDDQKPLQREETPQNDQSKREQKDSGKHEKQDNEAPIQKDEESLNKKSDAHVEESRNPEEQKKAQVEGDQAHQNDSQDLNRKENQKQDNQVPLQKDDNQKNKSNEQTKSVPENQKPTQREVDADQMKQQNSPAPNQKEKDNASKEQKSQSLDNKKKEEEPDEKGQKLQSKQNLKKSNSMKSNRSKPVSEKEMQRQQQLINAYGDTANQQIRMKESKSQLFIRPASQIDKRIVHEQINSSHAKQLYSFSKAQRFPKKSKPYCHTQFYENQLQSQLGSRGTGIGYGNKFDFTKTDKYRPGPTSYEIQTCFENNIKNFKGVKFGFGREEAAKSGLLGNLNTAPGPGTYEAPDAKSNLKFSLGVRTKARRTGLFEYLFLDIYLVSTTPAPGTYNIGGLDSKGQYYVGKYRGSGAAVISPTSSHIYESRRTKRIPGPGTYNPPGGIKGTKDYLPSNYMTSSQWRFGSGIRVTQELPVLKTPGPGAYCIPSEFGDVDFPEPVDLTKVQK